MVSFAWFPLSRKATQRKSFRDFHAAAKRCVLISCDTTKSSAAVIGHMLRPNHSIGCLCENRNCSGSCFVLRCVKKFHAPFCRCCENHARLVLCCLLRCLKPDTHCVACIALRYVVLCSRCVNLRDAGNHTFVSVIVELKLRLYSHCESLPWEWWPFTPIQPL